MKPKIGQIFINTFDTSKRWQVKEVTEKSITCDALIPDGKGNFKLDIAGKGHCGADLDTFAAYFQPA